MNRPWVVSHKKDQWRTLLMFSVLPASTNSRVAGELGRCVAHLTSLTKLIRDWDSLAASRFGIPIHYGLWCTHVDSIGYRELAVRVPGLDLYLFQLISVHDNINSMHWCYILYRFSYDTTTTKGVFGKYRCCKMEVPSVGTIIAAWASYFRLCVFRKLCSRDWRIVG